MKGRERVARRFVKITDVRPYRLLAHSFCEFFVLKYGKPGRLEFEEFSFKEADLNSIDLEDIMTLIKYLQGPILRPQGFINGLEL